MPRRSNTPDTPLTPKQQRFVQEYLIDLNATQAAIRAGYSPKNADCIGPKLLAKPQIAALIAAAKQQRAERTGIDADWVLQQLKEIYDTDRTAIYTDDQKLRPIKDWPERLRRLLRGIKKSELLFYGDPVRVLELIGKHVAVNAFPQKFQHEFSTKDDVPLAIQIQYVRAPEAPSQTTGSKKAKPA